MHHHFVAKTNSYNIHRIIKFRPDICKLKRSFFKVFQNGVLRCMLARNSAWSRRRVVVEASLLNVGEWPEDWIPGVAVAGPGPEQVVSRSKHWPDCLHWSLFGDFSDPPPPPSAILPQEFIHLFGIPSARQLSCPNDAHYLFARKLCATIVFCACAHCRLVFDFRFSGNVL